MRDLRPVTASARLWPAVAPLLVAAVVTGGCQGRERRAIEQGPATGTGQASSTSTSTGVNGNPVYPGSQPDTVLGGGTGSDSGTGTGIDPLTGGVVPGSDPGLFPPGSSVQPGGLFPPGGSVQPGGTIPSNPGINTSVLPGGTTTGMVITTQLDNGQTVTIDWDGRSFKGNSRFDVVPE